MPVTELLIFFAIGSGVMLLYFILQALERIHATLIQERFFELLDWSADPVNDVELASIKQVLQSIMRIDW
jgi:hypothetical protein